MKKHLKDFALISVSFAVLTGFSQASAAQQIKLRVADSFPATHWISLNITKYMMEQVSARTNQKVEFEYYPAEQLGKAKDLLSLAVSGVTDIAYVAPGFVSDKMPLAAVGELPLPTASPSACPVTMAYWKIAKPGGLLDQEEFAPNGVRVLFSIVLPPYQLVTTAKFASVKDLAGMKIRTSGAPKELALRKLGAVPIQMPTPELNEAMSRRTVDGAVLPIGSVPAYGLDVIAKYFTVGENFGSFVANYVMSERKWKTLSPDVQKVLADMGEELSKRGCVFADREEAENINKLQKVGVTLVTLPAADKPGLREMQTSVSKTWADGLDKRGKAGTTVLNAFAEALR
ncbi:TRAP transporter substrate-binding protein DctP [Piscinibacter sakaiensis]|uniref:TRAP transporter substrate-binding protein n=1 Tax=Piscinibacter sakaiensis TaxID=1547922 RepID=UPI003AB05320